MPRRPTWPFIPSARTDGPSAVARVADRVRCGAAPAGREPGQGRADYRRDVDSTTDVYTVGELQLPSGIDLRDYDLATLSSTGGLGGANVALTDQFHHEIRRAGLTRPGPA